MADGRNPSVERGPHRDAPRWQDCVIDSTAEETCEGSTNGIDLLADAMGAEPPVSFRGAVQVTLLGAPLISYRFGLGLRPLPLR